MQGPANVTDACDLMAMKLLAIENRGDKRDFVDLYTMIQATHATLGEAIACYQRKYQRDAYAVAKALCYFRDADLQPEPELIQPLAWSDVKAWFRAAVHTWTQGRP